MHKFNTLKPSKSPLGRLYSSKQHIKSSKNHYDTLKISPHATQNEVKSAYYKLSLQYHPDKNKSGYARQKFQDISDAYEVLGNYELRKNYDRDVLIRQQPVSNTAQESTSQYKVYPGSSKIYNFDEWMQGHYGRQMDLTRMRRNKYEQHKKMKEVNSPSTSHNMEFVILLLTVMIAAMYMKRKIDQPVPQPEKNIEVDRKKN